ncbi:MAG: hypothetical protein AAAC47_26190, partial [Pararhizobium sp.]
LDDELGVPTLLPADMFAEKLLANADRCVDPSVNYRDALDIGQRLWQYSAGGSRKSGARLRSGNRKAGSLGRQSTLRFERTSPHF